MICKDSEKLLSRRGGDDELMYFVHSYYFETDDEFIVSRCQYGIEFPATVRHKYYTGMQFHPEKSGEKGLELLTEWVDG